mgnify:CR=1 FL=1
MVVTLRRSPTRCGDFRSRVVRPAPARETANGAPGATRKAVTTMHRRISGAVATHNRMASWIRRDYPKTAPDRGHCYLIALCGVDR